MVKVPDQVRSTHNHDGAVVLDIRQGQMFRLNFVGSRILELLRQGHAETQIVAEICQEFGASREIVEIDVRDFLAHLEKHQLLRLDPGDTHVPS